MIRTRSLTLGCVTLFASVACVVTVEDGGKSQPEATSTAVAVETAEVQPTSVETAAPTATASVSAPAKMCTRMGCVSMLKVDVVGGDKLAKGKYAIDVEADGKKGKCTFTAPTFCDDKAPKCEGDVEIDIMRTGCEPNGTPKIVALKLPTTPAAATVTVTRDGKKVGEAKLAPEYKEVRPNGPDCDPVCKSATDKIEVK